MGIDPCKTVKFQENQLRGVACSRIPPFSTAPAGVPGSPAGSKRDTQKKGGFPAGGSDRHRFVIRLAPAPLRAARPYGKIGGQGVTLPSQIRKSRALPIWYEQCPVGLVQETFDAALW